MSVIFSPLLHHPTFQVLHQSLPFSEPLDVTLNTMTMTGARRIIEAQCFEGHTLMSICGQDLRLLADREDRFPSRGSIIAKSHHPAKPNAALPIPRPHLQRPPPQPSGLGEFHFKNEAQMLFSKSILLCSKGN